METNTLQRPLSQRINVRLIVFLAVISAPFLYGAYAGAKYLWGGGIEDYGGGYKKVNLKALGFFQFDSNNGTAADVPSRFRALDGQKVVLEGYMFDPTGAGETVRHFQFVWNIQKCCFSGPPLVQERVFGEVPKGRTVAYVPDLARVFGTLHVNVQKGPDGGIISVYTMDVEKAEAI